MTTEDDLRHDLTLAMHTITETSQSIRFADTKAGALAGIQALMVSVLAAHRDAGPGTAARTLHAACMLGVVVSALLLAAGQVPRLLNHRSRPSRVAFPALTRMHADQVLRVPSLERRHSDAWHQATLLARIATIKFRWLARAAASTVLTLTSVLAWLAFVTWSSS